MEEMNQPRREERPTRPPHTHTAWAYQRTGRKTGRLLECGTGYIDRDKNVAHVVMNRQPLGGYTGYVQLLPFGVNPQSSKPRTLEDDDIEDDAED